MRSPRETCENKDRCGKTGHFQENGKWRRCPCLELEINQRALGEMYDEAPNRKTPLRGKLDNDLLISGPLNTCRKHVAGALISEEAKGTKFVVMDAYRLIEIFLEKDVEFETSRPALDTGLLVLLLGFGDPRNRYLPELLVQMLSRRNLIRRPTWVLLGVDQSQIGPKYSTELATILGKFELVNAR